MDAFDHIEEQIRRQEDRVKARELKQRLEEIERGLVEPPVQPTTKHTEPTKTKTKPFSKKIADIGKFLLIVVTVIVAIRLAAWIGTIMMVMGITWMAYKLFLESKAA